MRCGRPRPRRDEVGARGRTPTTIDKLCFISLQLQIGEAMDVMPFECAKCGVRFSMDGGRACYNCGQIFCLDHLRQDRDKNQFRWLCVDCNSNRPKEEDKH